MIARAGQQLAITYNIKPRIPAMHPGRARTLQNDRNQRGPGRVEHAFFCGVANDLVMRGHERLRKEFSRVPDDGTRFFLVQG